MKILTVCHCMQGRWRVKKSGVKPPSLPFPSTSFLPFPPPSRSSLSTPLPPIPPSLPSPPLPLEVDPLNPARGSGERCKHPQRGPGPGPQTHFWHILSLGNASEGNNFNDFTVFFTDFVSLLLDGCSRIVSSLWFEFFLEGGISIFFWGGAEG